VRPTVRAVLLATFALSLGFAGSAQGAITVTNTNDAGPGSLRAMVEAAPAGETINLPAGTYTLTSEALFIDKSLSLVGHGQGDTILRSGGPFQVILAVPSSMGKMNLAISDLTVRDGLEPGGNGGGILAVETNLSLLRTTVTANRATANGAPGGEGGSANGGGILAVSGSLTLVESAVTNNTAEAIGGVGAKGGDALGGGIYSTAGPLTIERSTVSGNRVDSRGGQGPSDPEQDAGETGGAGLLVIANEAGANVSITGSTIAENTGDSTAGPGGEADESAGGGIFLIANVSTFTATNTTIAANTLRGTGSNGEQLLGGGLFAVSGPEGKIDVTASTIASNRLESTGPKSAGGNVLAAGNPDTIHFADTIVSGGLGPAASANCFTFESETIASRGFNLESSDQCGFHGNGDKVNTDPLLGPLQGNGGVGATMGPAANSPAVDQGSAFGLPSDERGVFRPIDLPSIPNSSAPGADGSDIGAVELQPSNALKLGKLKKNKKKGTATLTVTLPQPSAGTLVLTGKGLKKLTKSVTGQASLKLKIAGKGKVAKALRKKGKRKVQIKVTYTPTGNSALTLTKKAKLVKKKPKKRKKS
jgi:hypothetical protein